VLESRSLAASVSLLREWVIEVKRSSTLWITQRRRDGMFGRDWIAGRYWGIRLVISWMLFEAAGYRRFGGRRAMESFVLCARRRDERSFRRG